MPPALRWPTLMLGLVAFLFLFWSGQRSGVDDLISLTGEAGVYAVGLTDDSQVAEGFGVLYRTMFPPTISRSTPLEDIEGFDPEDLPWLARIEVVEQLDVEIDYETLEQDITVARDAYLVEPLGYLGFVLWKMLETIEIGIWGTIVAIILSIPLAYLSARNLSPHWLTYGFARGTVSLFRSIPELVSALFFVLAYGFGPLAGILALGFHCTGFLGKFYAEDIENAEKGPQEVLEALGASRLKILRIAILPQVIPQYIAYTLYILDRNVRMATVVGLVGAGGIGQELKGRWDIFHYSHVTTILIVLFLTVLLLDQFSARIRRHLLR
jgi:phosphonate transport system permease protein